MKFRSRNIIIAIVLLLVVLIGVAIQYYHFRGIKDSLERMVHEKTKGEYTLDMGETTYDFYRLDFTLKDARIYRIDTLNQKRIYSVELPKVRINLGSIQSYFSFGQIYVKEFVVDEPLVVLQKENSKKQKLNLSTELAQMLRIIKEVLDSFNIRSFKIVKGAFKVTKGSQEIRVGLIDFLAQEWNVRRLTNRSQIKIDIGAQELAIFKHAFSFNQIEYSYLKRQMRISDFRYYHHDSLSGIRMEAKGKQLLIDHMDWEKLYSADRYKFKKIELSGVTFKGSFPPGAHKKKKGINFARAVYETLGEFYIDSLLVRDADVDLSYKRRNDSSSVSLKKASFSLLDLKLIGTGESFEVGQVKFNLNRTALGFGKDYLIRFDSLIYNANQTAHRRPQWIVAGVEVTDKTIQRNFLKCGTVVVTDFDPFDFLLHKKLKAESLELQNVTLDILPERLKKRTGSGPDKTMPDINIDRLLIRDANVAYRDQRMNVKLDKMDMSFQAIHIVKNKTPTYSFEWLDFAHMSYVDSAGLNHIETDQVYIDLTKILSRSVNVHQKGKLAFELSDVRVGFYYDSLVMLLKDSRSSFNSLRASKLVVTGSVGKNDRSQKLPVTFCQKVELDTLLIQVSTHNAQVNLRASDFVLRDLVSTTNGWQWGQLVTKLQSFSYSSESMEINGRESVINSFRSSRISNIRFRQKDTTITFVAKEALVSPFKGDGYFDKVSFTQPYVTFNRGSSIQFTSQVDSVTLHQIDLNKKEIVKRVNIYHPVIALQIQSKLGEEQKPSGKLGDQVGEIQIDHARIDLSVNLSKYQVYDFTAHWKKDQSYFYSIDSVTTQNKNFTFALHKISYKPEQFDFESVKITPRETIREYSATGFERDWLQMSFNQVQVKGLQLDTLLKSKNIRMDEMTIGAFRIDAMRDKRLPDPPFKEKPLFSRRLYTMTRQLDIPILHLKNGTVNVMQISQKTEDMATLEVDHIAGQIKNIHSTRDANKKLELNIQAQIDGSGLIQLDYLMEDIDRFKFDADISDLDLSAFNSMIQPLQSVRFKSGKLKSLKLNAIANNTIATGQALINYQDLRIEILKKERAMFGNELLSALANQLIKNNRRDALAPLTQERDKSRSEFNYWVKIFLKGASDAARRGKRIRH